MKRSQLLLFLSIYVMPTSAQQATNIKQVIGTNDTRLKKVRPA